ncbi:MAG: GatB/YqeY domain-containing protein [Patescibacteria group bacterium]|nr:GatB/YqeY domain-containing protein [Patescibacteria group bacterium]MBU1877105.1 GatB/YqeY domain-containing protein [Patescibacteria group bacterium]
MLKENIKSDLEHAIKEQKTLNMSVLRMLSAVINNKEIEKRFGLSKVKPDLNPEQLDQESQLTDDEIINTISSEIKKRKESIEMFTKGNRIDLAQKESQELEILKKYLPEQISEEELKNIIQQVIEKLGAKEIKDMGSVIKEVMAQVKGRADGSLVSKIVKDLLVNG